MDYLAQAQKDLEIAKSMVTNGIYPNIDDALKEIQRRKSEQGAPVQAVQPAAPVAQPVAQPVQPTAPVAAPVQATVPPELVQRIAKLEQVLQDFGKFFVDFRAGMETKVNSFQKDLNALSTKIDNARSAPSPALRGTPGQSSPAQASPAAEKPYNERQGNFNSTDVAIEDIFSNAGGRLMK